MKIHVVICHVYGIINPGGLMKEYILFDLDGTLTDPGLGITNSVIHALKKFNITPPKNEELYCFIGPPLIDSFMKYYSLTKEEAVKAVEYYREYYVPTGMFENAVYEGIDELLDGLTKSGRKVYLATSKPEVFAVQILEHYNLAKYFTFIGGSTLDETRTNKADVITYVLENAGITDKDKVIMVGDRHHDITGAVKNGLQSIGVLFGYGDEEELRSSGATYIAEDVDTLRKIISGI